MRVEGSQNIDVIELMDDSHKEDHAISIHLQKTTNLLV